MTTIFVLILLALVLVFFEVILPGGLLGALAGICIIVATWLGFSDYGLLGGFIVFMGSLLATGALVFAEFKFMADLPFGKGFFLKSVVSGHSNESPGEESLCGREGITVTRLNPGGKVAIGGESYEAHSQDGYIDSGQAVSVVSRDNFKLIVKKL